MLLELPRDLHYPITIRKITKRPGEDVEVRDALFRYTYVTKVKHGDRYTDEETEVDKIIAADFESPVEGKIEKWLVWTDDVIRQPREIIDITEPCKHSVQFNGLCTECGKDMTGYVKHKQDFLDATDTDYRIEVPAGAGTERANIQAAHDTDKLLISQEEASEVDESSKRRLLQARKLSLVVDLDQTIIHAAVDPTIGEWQKDPDNPNYEALKDVRSFKLSDDGPGMHGCNYYIKLRPGLGQFLKNIAELYELHIYTMGTRQYAQQIATLVDPDREHFGDRILSRDESGSMVAKNLTRLFPVDTRMVVIIDDRGDVWKWSPNLVRVSAFDFFVGIGDINAGFLPKKQDIPSPSKPETKSTTNGKSEDEERAVNGENVEETDTPTDTTALQQVVAMNDPTMQEVQTKVQEETIVSQLEQKPLLKLQQQLDEKDGVTTTPQTEPPATQNTDSDSSSDSDSSNSPKAKARHSIFRNDDDELFHLEKSLRLVHDRFFAEYDKKRKVASPKTGRVAQLSGKGKAPLADTTIEPDTLNYVPDVKRIMPAMKDRVLDGVTIAFSGVLPLGVDIQTADISIWARSFGATITDKVTRDVTHVVAARVGTQKVKTAVKKNIKVVGTDWLMRSIQRWKKLDERPFLLPGIGQRMLDDDHENADHPPKAPRSEVSAQDLLEDNKVGVGPDFLLSSEDEAEALTETDEDRQKQPKKKKLKLDLQPHGADNTYPVPEGLEESEEARSPVSDINKDEWDAIGDELKDFLGSDMDTETESDAESIRNETTTGLRSKKRRRDDDNTEGLENNHSGDERNGDSTSGRANKLQKAGSGGSALRAVSNAESTGQDATTIPKIHVVREQTQEEYEADMAAELERELEAAEAAENGDG